MSTPIYVSDWLVRPAAPLKLKLRCRHAGASALQLLRADCDPLHSRGYGEEATRCWKISRDPNHKLALAKECMPLLGDTLFHQAKLSACTSSFHQVMEARWWVRVMVAVAVHLVR